MVSQFVFLEQHEYEEGFSEVYKTKIAPILQNMEIERKNCVKRSRIWIAILAMGSACLAWQALKLHPVLPLFPLLAGAGAVLFVFLSRHDNAHGEFTNIVRPILCNFFEDITYSKAPNQDAFPSDQLRNLNLIPAADRTYLGPSIEGTWRNVSYSMTEASFYSERRDNEGDRVSKRLFSGVVMNVECFVSMPTIVFLPDFGETLNKVYRWTTRNNRPKQKLYFPAGAVEGAFEVYTDDLDRAQNLLPPNFGLKLLEFSGAYQKTKRSISAAFKGKKLFIVIGLDRGFMDFDVFDAPLSEADAKIHEALADLMMPRKIIDNLLEQ